MRAPQENRPRSPPAHEPLTAGRGTTIQYREGGSSIVEIRVLGPLEVVEDDTVLAAGGPTQRAVLAVLTTTPRRVVTTERLIAGVWGDEPPDAAEHAIQSHVSRLRAALRNTADGPGVIRSVEGGYVLDAEPEAIDAGRFGQLVATAEDAAATARCVEAREAAAAALALWRGPAYLDVRRSRIMETAAARLEDLRLRALELRVGADLDSGNDVDLVPELRSLTAEHPERERFWVLLVRALYRGGRQTEALEAYRRAAGLLRDEIGIDPGPELREIEQRVLRQDPSLDRSGTAPSPPPIATQPRIDALPPALSARATPLVGRDTELENLRQAWGRVHSDGLVVAAVSGEAGIGKTRLAAEIAAETHESGGTVLYGACSQDLATPYEPFAAALRQRLAAAGAQAPLGEHPADLTHLVPQLHDLLPDLGQPLTSDPETQRHRLFTAVGSWLRAAAGEAATLLVLDDLHWADAGTVSLLRHLAREAAGAPILVLATYRDTDIDRDHPISPALVELARLDRLLRIDLPGLNAEDIGTLIRSAWSQTHLADRADEVAATLWHETDGNAFFVNEVLRHLAAATDDPAGVPRTIRDVVMQRLAHLPEHGGRVIAGAAVFGDDFSVPALAAALDESEDRVLDALDAAAAANLVREIGVAAYRFTHALVRTTLYEELSATRRARLHLTAARALEDRDADPAEIAGHYTRSVGVADDAASRAVDHLLVAGRSALDRLAPDQASGHFAEALSLLDTLDDSDSARAAVAMLGLGAAQRDAGDVAYRQTLLDAAEIAQRSDDPLLLAQAALINHRGLWSGLGTVDRERVAVLRAALGSVPDGHAELRARLLARLAIELVFDPVDSDVVALVEEAEALAAELGDDEVLVEVLAAKVTATWNPATAAHLHADAEQMLAIAERIGDPMRIAHASAWLGIHLRTIGDTESAARATQRTADVARQLDDEPTMAFFAVAYRCAQATLEGALDDAERLAMETLERGQAAGHADVMGWFLGQVAGIRLVQGRLHELLEDTTQDVAAIIDQLAAVASFRAGLALMLTSAGRPEEARPLFEDLVDHHDAIPFDWAWLQTMFLTGLVAHDLDDAARAARVYELLHPYAGLVANGGATMLGPIDHALALTARTAGRPDDVGRHFAAALALEDRAGLRAWADVTRLQSAQLPQ